MVLAYDYTVFAGTQGTMGHEKLDRMLALAAEWRLPIVLFAEGGGGRPNDTDVHTVAGLDTPSFLAFAALSGLVPRVGIVSGRCFAGNAALLGCCDVIIATENSSIGMGGPAMIEGGGLGTFTPEEVGPIDVQTKNGVVDVRVPPTRPRRSPWRRSTSRYFQGPLGTLGRAADQTALRDVMPESRRRVYKIRPDPRDARRHRHGARAARASFGRIDRHRAGAASKGAPVGLIANDTYHLGGAIDADAADKAARFMQLCDAFGLPDRLALRHARLHGRAEGREHRRSCATPRACSSRRRASRCRSSPSSCARATASARRRWPAVTSTRRFFTVAWPTGEFGGMGLEGAVRLGMKKELEAIADPQEREQTFQAMVAVAYERGKAINMASLLELDARHRPGRYTPLAPARPEVGATAAREDAPLHRYVVTSVEKGRAGSERRDRDEPRAHHASWPGGDVREIEVGDLVRLHHVGSAARGDVLGKDDLAVCELRPDRRGRLRAARELHVGLDDDGELGAFRATQREPCRGERARCAIACVGPAVSSGRADEAQAHDETRSIDDGEERRRASLGRAAVTRRFVERGHDRAFWSEAERGVALGEAAPQRLLGGALRLCARRSVRRR